MIYSESLIAGPHCECFDGIASRIDLSPPADRHRILRRSRESFCPSSARCFCFHRVTPTPLTTGVFSIALFIVFTVCSRCHELAMSTQWHGLKKVLLVCKT